MDLERPLEARREYDDGPEPDDDYVSPGLARLESLRRGESPLRQMLGAVPWDAPDLARTAELKARLARLEQQHGELANDLDQARQAFGHLLGQVDLLAERVGQLTGLLEAANRQRAEPAGRLRPWWRRWLA
jgi:hypothetical protein